MRDALSSPAVNVTSARGSMQLVFAEKFKVIQRLASQPKGEVLLVESRSRNFRTVVKTMELEAFPESQRRWEAELQQMCEHPHVVQVFGQDVYKTTRYIEMEYMKGGSLADRLATRFVPVSQSLHYIKQILSALIEVHNQGIIHRDIGAENIMISGAIVKLADFGSAVHVRSGKVVSDLVYAPYAPPKPGPHQTFSEATDVFAAGLTLLRATNNLPQFHSTITNIRRRILNSEKPEFDSMEDFIPCDAYVPGKLRDIIRKAVSLDASSGYLSARALKADLDRLRVARDWHRVGNGRWLCSYRGREERIELIPGIIPTVRYTGEGRQRFQKIFRDSSTALKHLHQFISETTLA